LTIFDSILPSKLGFDFLSKLAAKYTNAGAKKIDAKLTINENGGLDISGHPW